MTCAQAVFFVKPTNNRELRITSNIAIPQVSPQPVSSSNLDDTCMLHGERTVVPGKPYRGQGRQAIDRSVQYRMMMVAEFSGLSESNVKGTA
jgi:hypothetical protein